MANDVLWNASTAVTLVANWKNLATAGFSLGEEYDNTSGRHMFMQLELLARYGTNPSAGGYVAVRMIGAPDGTNYGDASTTNNPIIATFLLRAVTTQQRISLPYIIPIPPIKFKCEIENQAGQTSTNTDSENILKARLFEPEIQ